jgi:hypothetical protein
MLLYNVTVGIDKEVEERWIQWMKEIHIPRVLGTGLFVSHKFYRILHDNQDGTSSYSIQYFSNSLDDVQRYLEEFAPGLIREHLAEFKDRHVAFRTLLEEI